MAELRIVQWSDEDLAVVRKVCQEVLGERINAPVKTPSIKLHTQSPEVQIVLPRETIPALTRVGTGSSGTAAEGDQPGSGMCDGYDIIEGQLRPTNQEFLVYNLTTNEIGIDWITIKKTKFNRWVPASAVGVAVGVKYGIATSDWDLPVSCDDFVTINVNVTNYRYTATGEVLECFVPPMEGDSMSGVPGMIQTVIGYPKPFFIPYACEPCLGTGSGTGSGTS